MDMARIHLGLFMLLALGTGTAYGQSPKGAPKPLPETVRKAWEKAGALSGWMGEDDFTPSYRSGGDDGKAGEVPAFRVGSDINADFTFVMRLALPVPQPEQGFGIDASDCSHSDLKGLATFKRLEKLDIGNHFWGLFKGSLDAREPSGLAGINEIAKMEALQVLGARATHMNDKDLQRLAALKNFRKLDASYSGISDAGLVTLAQFPHLEALDVSSIYRLTDKGVKSLAACKKLKALDISGSPATPAVLVDLKRLTELRVLNLGSIKVTDADIKMLLELKELRSLNLWGTEITDAGAKILATQTLLERLDLGRTKITDAALADLAESKSLRSLKLTFCGIQGAGIKRLAANKQIRVLNLSHTQVDDAALKELGRMEQLESLNLWSEIITDAGVAELAKLKNLRFLEVNGAKISEEAATRLRRALPKLEVRRSFLA